MAIRIKMETMGDCILRIQQVTGVDEKEARRIIQKVGLMGDRLRTAGAPQPFIAAASQVVQDIKVKARRAEINRLNNEAKTTQVAAGATSEGIGKAGEKLESRLTWTPGKQFKQAVQNVGEAIVSSQWLGPFYSFLKETNTVTYAAQKSTVKDILREIMARDYGGPTSKTTQAGQVAGKTHEILTDVMRRLNASGAWIKRPSDLLTQGISDGWWMLRGGKGQPKVSVNEAFDKWWEFVEPKLKPNIIDRLLPLDGETEAETLRRFGQEYFTAHTLGMKGERYSTNFAAKYSREGMLEFKDSDSLAEYMGRYSVHNNIMQHMMHLTQSTAMAHAMMQEFGTNPVAGYHQVVEKISNQFKNDDLAGVQGFHKYIEGSVLGFRPALENVVKHITGMDRLPVSDFWFGLQQGFKSFYTSIFLGGVGATNLLSMVATFPRTARMYGGIGSLKGLGELLVSMLPNWTRDGPEIMGFADGYTRLNSNVYAHGVSIPGHLSLMANFLMKASGFNYINDHAKLGMMRVIGSNFGRMAQGAWEHVKPIVRQTAELYGIGKDEWDVVQGAALVGDSWGNKLLTPEAIMGADEGKALAYANNKSFSGTDAEKVQAVRAELAQKYMVFLHDAAGQSVVQPGAREQAFIYGNSMAGTPSAFLKSMMFTFKAAPIAAITQALQREMYQNLSKVGAIGGVGMLAALSVVGGYLRWNLGRVSNGQPLLAAPKDPKDAMLIILHSMAAGGGLGTYADFAFGEVQRSGQFSPMSLGGPLASDVAGLYNVWNDWLSSVGTDHPKDFWPQLTRFGVQHIPFNNLIYTKGSLNYLLWYNVYEALNPGFWARTNRRSVQENGAPLRGYTPGQKPSLGAYWTGAAQ